MYLDLPLADLGVCWLVRKVKPCAFTTSCLGTVSVRAADVQSVQWHLRPPKDGLVPLGTVCAALRKWYTHISIIERQYMVSSHNIPSTNDGAIVPSPPEYIAQHRHIYMAWI